MKRKGWQSDLRSHVQHFNRHQPPQDIHNYDKWPVVPSLQDHHTADGSKRATEQGYGDIHHQLPGGHTQVPRQEAHPEEYYPSFLPTLCVESLWNGSGGQGQSVNKQFTRMFNCVWQSPLMWGLSSREGPPDGWHSPGGQVRSGPDNHNLQRKSKRNCYKQMRSILDHFNAHNTVLV